MIALVSISYLVVLVVYHFVEGDTMADRGPIRVFKWGSLVETLQSFPVIVFAYTCHQNVSALCQCVCWLMLTLTDVRCVKRD